MNNIQYKHVTWMLAALLIIILVWHYQSIAAVKESTPTPEVSTTVSQNTSTSETHVMPDGTVMSNHTPAPSMDQMMHDMNASLRGKTGDELDKAFLSEMIVHHQGAVDMAEMVSSSKHPELVKLGQDIIIAQKREIEMMKQWQKEWFK